MKQKQDENYLRVETDIEECISFAEYLNVKYDKGGER